MPLVQAIREAGDAGRPAALQEGTDAAKAIGLVTDRLLETVANLSSAPAGADPL